jgi:citrate lyase subunit beta/citryl-CoA lyase
MTGLDGVADVPLTWLYVPADRDDRAAKAYASAADVVILDLEDAVAASSKPSARDRAADLVAAQPARPAEVRVNALDAPWAADDLAMVRELPASVGVRVPKVTSAADVALVLTAVGERRVHCLLESAAGVEAAYSIAQAPGVVSIGLGEADLRSDLGVSDDAGLAWSRQRIVVAARAAALRPPAMAVFTNVTDVEGLAASCREGRRLGFVGRAAIHPRQLPVIESSFRPSPEEVTRAQRVVDAVAEASSDGVGTVLLADGSFLDVAMVEHARRVLALASRPHNPR